MKNFSPAGCAATRMAQAIVLVMILEAGSFVVCPAIAIAGLGDQELTRDQIRDATRDVMSDRDFRRLHEKPVEEPEGWLSRLLEWLSEWRESENDTSEREVPGAGPIASGIGQLVMIVGLAAVIAVIAVIVVLVIRSIDRSRQKKSLVSGPGLLDDVHEIAATAPGELAANEYRTRADRLAEDGNLAAAIRELLLGGMSWIERAGMIRFRRGLTNRDYWRAVFADDFRRDAFASLAGEFEKVYFGRREATSEMYQLCLRSFESGFAE